MVAFLLVASALVDVFIGTQGTGHVSPAACVPFGLVQPGPDTGCGDWAHCAGYQYGDPEILGFSQTHLSGTGCADLTDIRLFPFAGEAPRRFASRYDKSTERAEPGFYEVTLKDVGTSARMTATERVALHEFRYQGEAAGLLLDFAWGVNGWYDTCSRPVSDIRFDGDRVVCGTLKRRGWCDRDVHFRIEFDRPIVSRRELSRPVGEDAPSYVLGFGPDAGGTLKVKCALSTVSAAGAARNMSVELPGWDFAAVRRAAAAKWDDVFSRAEAEGPEEQVKLFYTSLYRLCVQPNVISDAGEPVRYSTFSFWDTFRAAHPLYTILFPERVPDFVDSILEQGRRTGYLPIWSLWGRENQCMIGTHSVPVLVDAYLKGLVSPSFDAKAAFAQVRDTLRMRHGDRRKEGWDDLDRYGYYPFDVAGAESVSRTLECSYDDACAARFAEALGEKEDAEFFRRRASNWTNVFDRSVGFMRARDSMGRWRTPFDPAALGDKRNGSNDFTEGNSWQYSWHVLQDVPGLIEAMGGCGRFVRRLEGLFAAPSELKGAYANDVTGLIGQYAHGNEPSHHVAYLFRCAGRRDLTAKYVREICRTQYRAAPDGLCGNEDCGQMSAWYVFACLGFYPVDPCGGEYVLGAPQLDRVTLRLPGGKTFSAESCPSDGASVARNLIHHSDIMRGGKIR